ncbi:MAG: NADP-dependent oxidoreductase [Sporocytophaga sp.]|uniref:NADP-dependent oxidoreductase n=1 Tax=Sporocytophaga sp. TaxID=2231183 RepID=UPI001B023ABD|nr:NADP-dependent oxidoreductase [Sporocytophaga sp.]MBO9702966.1 NADP-dependent oxidoreductase [Sporocytophaga sp.]
MKAINLYNYGTAETLQFNETLVPQINEDQVLVKVYAASVNHIDGLKASGAIQQIYPLQFPWIPGSDFSGKIEALGSKVTGFKVGDEVYGNSPTGGAYAEYVAANPNAISQKPKSLSFIEAASVPVVAGTAWQGLFKYAHLISGQTILIHGGAGAVGAYAVQFAHQAGAKVIVTASGTDKAYLTSLGADEVIDYKTNTFESMVNDVDVVFDLVGGEVQKRSYSIIKKGGYLIATNQPVSEEDALKHKFSGIFMHHVPSSKDLSYFAELFDKGLLKADIAKVFSIEKTSEAWKALSLNLPGKILPHTDKNYSWQDKKHGKIVLELFNSY